jgi:hypothetical protein
MSTLSQANQTQTGPVFFRLAPEFRRCGVYLFVGCLLLVGTVIGLEQLGLGRGWGEAIPLTAFAVPMLGVVLLTQRQLLRVDDRGVWRRRFFRWDLWSWEAFSAGQVHQGTGKDSFILPSKPWRNRYLHLEFLQEHDREHLADRIRCVWTPPPLRPPPEELTIRWGFRRWARLSQEGIEVGQGKRNGGFFPWAAVSRVRITRLGHGRQDFRAAEAILPEVPRPIRLVMHRGRPLWTGADSETLGAFLEQAVPPARLLLTAMIGPPRSVAEADWRILDVNRMEREAKQVMWIYWPGLLAAVVLLLLVVIVRVLQPNPPPWDFARIFGVASMCLLVGCVATLGCYTSLSVKRHINAMRGELAAWREGLQRRGAGVQ